MIQAYQKSHCQLLNHSIPDSDREVKSARTAKKQQKKQQKQMERRLDNLPSYDPAPERRGRRNIDISKKLTDEIIPKEAASMSDCRKGAIYKFMEKGVAMQLNDCPELMQRDTVAIDFDFHDQKEQPA